MSKKFDYVTSQREDVDAIPLKWQSTVQRVMKYYTRLNVWVYKKTSGRLMRNFPGGYPICIVGMKGKKSGKHREIALIHLPWGDKKLLVASQGGMENHPLWYFNICANPQIDIMVGGDTQSYLAELASPEQKRELWPHLLSMYPDSDSYQARTDRDIPVFICEPQ
jgi:deazaflavin-dependent oxidoreductase (nitroreductase family)